MKRIAPIVGLLAVVLVSCQGRESTDKEKLQGTWQMVSGERGGEPMEEIDKITLVIKGNDVVFGMAGGSTEGEIRIDHGRDPKVFDMVLGVVGKPEEKGPVSKGIYKIEGDTLTWCNAAPGVDERPMDFTTSKENNRMLVVFERVASK